MAGVAGQALTPGEVTALAERRPSAVAAVMAQLAVPSARLGKNRAAVFGASASLVLVSVAMHADLRRDPAYPSFPRDLAVLTGLSASTCAGHLRTWHGAGWLERQAGGRYLLAPALRHAARRER